MDSTIKIKGLPSGYQDLDEITGGWHKSDLIVIAGRPGMGKTSLALGMVKNIAVGNKIPTAYFSMDLSNVQLVNNLIANFCNVEESKILNDGLQADEWKRIDEGVNVLMDAPLYVDDTQNQSIDEVSTKIKKLVQEHGVKIAFIDSLQLMEGQNCIQSLKALAKELTTPIIVLSQAEGLPQDADIVLSVNRKDEGTALISIADNTQGNNGEVIVSFK
jgi:replicative DNA helicase